jgi:alpha/beta superfamily hydrolase
MPAIQDIFIPNRSIKLEVEYFKPENDTSRDSILIIHPHPQFGGDMYNNVISSIFKTFVNENIAALRFNFRGVGNSTGNHTDGEGERSDVEVCIDFLIEDLNMESVFLCGYSYGAAIGCSSVNYSEKVIGYAAVSFPFDFMDESYKKDSQTIKPKLFIQGNRDNIARFENFNKHFNFFNEPKQYKIIDGADHFYWGFEDEITRMILAFYLSLQ